MAPSLRSIAIILSAWLALISAAVGILAVGLERGWFELALDDLKQRYALPTSQFVNVDGVDVHFTVQGEGNPVVLLHASYLNLRSWDAVAAELEKKYQVVRLDLSGAGLTGTDPTGGYGVDRNIDLVRGVMRHLGLSRVSLVGTSSGGISAFRMAARHPAEVARLILINSAGMPRTAATNPLQRPTSPAQQWVQARLRSRDFWRNALTDNFVAPHFPADDLVQMTYDLNRRAGGREIAAQYIANFSTGDPETMLGKVQAPTLVIWGMENRTLMHLEADVFARWLANAPRMTLKYPGTGHYLYLEEPAQTAADIDAFLQGAFDGRLQYPCDTR